MKPILKYGSLLLNHEYNNLGGYTAKYTPKKYITQDVNFPCSAGQYLKVVGITPEKLSVTLITYHESESDFNTWYNSVLSDISNKSNLKRTVEYVTHETVKYIYNAYLTTYEQTDQRFTGSGKVVTYFKIEFTGNYEVVQL